LTVYIVFDPAGIWELGEPVYATRDAAEAVVAAHPPSDTSFGPGTYRLHVREFQVQEAARPC
jgi:hypothetical protein